MLSAGVAQASLFGRTEINLDSQAQVTDALLNLGVPVPDTTRAWQLQPLAEKYPVVAKLLEYRGVAKATSSFGEKFLEFIEPKTGRIHADFRQIGAPTGRFSCSKPNLQQIPHEDVYRRCFRAPEGRKLVIADYSQIELRILADFSQDKNFIEAFESGQDFHAATAAQVFGIVAADVTSDQRSFAKRLNFGVVYGIGASRFALMTGLSQTDAENTLRKYFATYPRMDEWLRLQAQNVLTERQTRTASGRLAKFRFEENDRASVAAAQRYAKNMPIQGTSADILKRALRLLHNDIAGTPAKLVNIVHDEIVVECDAADNEFVSTKLESAMQRAGVSGSSVGLDQTRCPHPLPARVVAVRHRSTNVPGGREGSAAASAAAGEVRAGGACASISDRGTLRTAAIAGDAKSSRTGVARTLPILKGGNRRLGHG